MPDHQNQCQNLRPRSCHCGDAFSTREGLSRHQEGCHLCPPGCEDSYGAGEAVQIHHETNSPASLPIHPRLLIQIPPEESYFPSPLPSPTVGNINDFSRPPDAEKGDIAEDGIGNGDTDLPADSLSQEIIRNHNENTITAISDAKNMFDDLTRAQMGTRAQADANAILGILERVTQGIPKSVKEASKMEPRDPSSTPTAEYILCNLEEAVQLFKDKVPPWMPVVVKGACEDLKTIEGFLEELKFGDILNFHDSAEILEEGQTVYAPETMKSEDALALFEQRRNLAGLAMNFLDLFGRKDNSTPKPFANNPDYSLMGCARDSNGKAEKPAIRDLISGMTFHLLATKGAGHLPHIDRHGMWTTALCEEGKKLWLQWPNLDLETIKSREVPHEGIAVLLEKGDMLIQPPNTLHAPLTLEDCLMTGTMHWHSSQLLDILLFTKAAVEDPSITNEGMAAQFVPTMRHILNKWKSGKCKYKWPPEKDMDECFRILEWLDQGCKCKGNCSATKSARCKCKRQNRVCDTRCHFSETYKECCQEKRNDGRKPKGVNALKRKAGEVVENQERDASRKKAMCRSSTRNRKAD
ncbi:hypothetical protein F53441_12946 [Fusarium austroafricanum]|uniref:JmjC domain-containing protein n=1 Tax=Fusarium austroafricanum TaxID=2364996 RepID=A0A8H4NJU5_9HYPO|nr:hypothetical protein F53441_12946 [Fusarium austroafricanum]